MADFRELLELKTDEVKAPVALPEGTYHGTISSFEYGDNNKNKTPYVRFSIRLHGAGDDVAPEALEGVDLAARRLTSDFYLTPDAMYRLKDFLGSLGLEIEGVAFGELIPNTINAEVSVYIKQRVNVQNPTEPARNFIDRLKGAAA